MAHNDTPWDAPSIEQLRDLWAKDLSTMEIARRMGRNKNSIIGKAHRLKLSARLSPIIRAEKSHQRRTPHVRGATLAPLCSVAIAVLEPGEIAASPAAIPLAAIVAPIAQPPASRDWMGACCWPFGEPRTASFRYCDAPIAGGGPYCPSHAKQAYQTRRPVARVDARLAKVLR